MTSRHAGPPAWLQNLLLRRLPPGPVGRSIIGDLHEEFTSDRNSGGLMRALVRYLRKALSVGIRFRGRAPRGLTPQRSAGGRGAGSMAAFWQDVRMAARLLAQRPGLTTVAVLSLGLGIGANASIFTLVDTVLLRPLPYPQAEELVGVYRIDPAVTGPHPDVSRLAGLYAVPYEVHRDWIRMSTVFAAAGGYATDEVTLLGSDAPISVRQALMSSGAFAALGITPALGRSLVPDDDRVGASSVAVLSYGLWQSRFGADTGVVGRVVSVDGTAYTVVGVMPPGFAFPDSRVRLWTSFSDDLKTSPVRNGGYMQVVARLSEGLSLEEAQREMDQVARRIGALHSAEAEHGIGLYRLKDLTLAGRGSTLLILMAAVTAVLLIACTNIAGLLLVRATERRREIGVRKALGAGSGRLVLQQLYESLILSLLGGAAGWGLARVGMVPFLSLMPSELPRLGEVRVDSGLLVAAGVLALLAGLLIGLLPAVKAVATPITSVIQGSGRGVAGGRSTSRTHRMLVVAQVALAFVLLAGAGLFVRSMMGLLAVNPGFRADGVVVASVETPPDRRDGDPLLMFVREVEERFAALPGVAGVGAANEMPFSGGWSAPPVSVESPRGIWSGILHVATVLPGYEGTMGIPILEGRALSPGDGPASEPVVIVSQSLARPMAPEGSALGMRVRINTPGDSVWRTVVGVVGDVVYRLNSGPVPMFYVPVAQRRDRMENWVIRTAGDPAGVVAGIRQVAREMNPEAASTVRALTEAIRDSEAAVSSRFMVTLLGGLAGLAAVLAVLGVYGVLAYLVQLRSHEIGIQMALGADSGRVLSRVLRRGLLMAGVGTVVGVGLALLLGRVVQSELFGIRSWDPLTLGSVAAALLGSALAASYIPARRAAALDPVTVLRGE